MILCKKNEKELYMFYLLALGFAVFALLIFSLTSDATAQRAKHTFSDTPQKVNLKNLLPKGFHEKN